VGRPSVAEGQLGRRLGLLDAVVIGLGSMIGAASKALQHAAVLAASVSRAPCLPSVNGQLVVPGGAR
jgi:hypothetical protein